MAKKKRATRKKKKPKRTYVDKKTGRRKKSMYADLDKGAFTRWCKGKGYGNVQACARHVLANKNKYSSTVVKRAQFARTQKKIARKK